MAMKFSSYSKVLLKINSLDVRYLFKLIALIIFVSRPDAYTYTFRCKGNRKIGESLSRANSAKNSATAVVFSQIFSKSPTRMNWAITPDPTVALGITFLFNVRIDKYNL